MGDATPFAANQFIETQLSQKLTEIENMVELDAISYTGPIYDGVDDLFRRHIEARKEKREGLAVFLETDGGIIETVDRIVHVLRHNYDRIEFFIPNRAMSAGTVLVLSGDAIHMDYFSVLGPIDPQVIRKDGSVVPALGYWKQYQRLIDKACSGNISIAEVTLLLQGFDQAELYQYEMARNLSVDLLEDWLAKYKFKDWRQTETTQTAVTSEMKRERAKEIAEKLNDTERWFSHGRGIHLELLQEELKLKIDDFGQKKELSDAIKGYYNLLADFVVKRAHLGVINTPDSYEWLIDLRGE